MMMCTDSMAGHCTCQVHYTVFGLVSSLEYIWVNFLNTFFCRQRSSIKYIMHVIANEPPLDSDMVVVEFITTVT